MTMLEKITASCNYGFIHRNKNYNKVISFSFWYKQHIVAKIILNKIVLIPDCISEIVAQDVSGRVWPRGGFASSVGKSANTVLVEWRTIITWPGSTIFLCFNLNTVCCYKRYMWIPGWWVDTLVDLCWSNLTIWKYVSHNLLYHSG